MRGLAIVDLRLSNETEGLKAPMVAIEFRPSCYGSSIPSDPLTPDANFRNSD